MKPILYLALLACTTALNAQTPVWTVDEAENLDQEVATQKDSPGNMLSLASQLQEAKTPEEVRTLCTRNIQRNPDDAAETISQGTRHLVHMSSPQEVPALVKAATEALPALASDFLTSALTNLGQYQSEWARSTFEAALTSVQGAENQNIVLSNALNAVERNPAATEAINQAAQKAGLEE